MLCNLTRLNFAYCPIISGSRLSKCATHLILESKRLRYESLKQTPQLNNGAVTIQARTRPAATTSVRMQPMALVTRFICSCFR